MPEKTSPDKSARAKTTPGKTDAPRAARPKPAPKPALAPKTTEGERIAKVLSRAGVASRREAERLIEAGEVQVNGKTITSAALNVTSRDKISVSGQPVGAPEAARLWLYYKPEGLVTSASDEKGRDTVFDHLPEDMPRVMSIGRLDLNSEGLLLLTNDGSLKRQLELPSTGWLRKYRVRVKGNPTDPDLEPLRKGITVEGERFQPMDVVLDRHQGSNAWLTIGLREGKNREIRRAINALGMIVNRLIRISYGPFRLNEMQPGEVEEVRARVMKDQLGALLSGPSEAEDDSTPERGRPPRPGKPGVRTSSRTGGDQSTSRRTTADDSPRPPRKAAATGKTSAPGKVTSARGRAALGTLSDTWVAATTPVRHEGGPRGEKQGTARGPKPITGTPRAKAPAHGAAKDPDTAPHRGQKGTGMTAAKRATGKPGTKPASKPFAKPPTRRK